MRAREERRLASQRPAQVVPEQDDRLSEHRHNEFQQLVERRPGPVRHTAHLSAGQDTVRLAQPDGEEAQLRPGLLGRRERRHTDNFGEFDIIF